MLEDFYLGNKSVWEVDDTEEETVKKIAFQLGLPALITKVMIKRGFQNTEEIKAFLKPTIKNLHHPFLLPDMEKAVKRILSAKNEKEKVIIYGDYDVDGITATSILYHFLKSLDMDVSFYIPDRMDEGYGISDAAADYLAETMPDLMITVDCGISAKNRIKQIQDSIASRGGKIDFIITDHHQPGVGTIPDVLAVVNPQLQHSEYPFSRLCGAGIAFKLVQALCICLDFGEKYLNYVDLAALGTVADIVSLTGENRILVWAGLKKIKRSPNRGIEALINTTGTNIREIDSYKLAFLLAPRVNAAGRMGNAARGVCLFTTSDAHEAEEVARQLNHENAKRQKIQEQIYQKAVDTIESDPSYQEHKILVVSGEAWHQGVIGIVASMLVDKYYKPCLVISVSGDTATGSGRSIEGFNIYSAMEYCSEHLMKFGGHEQAGGMTISTALIGKFRQTINEYAEQNLSVSMLSPRIKIDVEADINEVTFDTAKALLALAPFGEGNPSPVFKLKDISVQQKRCVGADGKHLKLQLGSGEHVINAIAFRMGFMESFIPLNKKIDLVFSIGINNYMGKSHLQINVKALRMAEKDITKNRNLLEAAEKVECLDYNEEWIYNGINNRKMQYEDIRLSREELGVLYRYLSKFGSKTLSRAQLFRLAEEISCGTTQINYFKLLSGMFIFDELDIIRFSYTKKGEYDLRISPIIEKASLEDSILYSFLKTVQQVVEK